MKGRINYLREKYPCTLTPVMLNYLKFSKYLEVVFINMRNVFNLFS